MHDNCKENVPAGKRNAKGNGSVRKRKNGTWEARCMINGKRKSFYGKKQSDVIKAMREAQYQADYGAYFEPRRTSLSEWLDVWLEEYVKISAKPLTYTTYQSRIDTHIRTSLGDIKLTSLNSVQIQAFYNDLLRKGLNPKTIKNVHGIIHKALQQAVNLRYIGINPADACVLPRSEKKEVSPLSESDVKAFLEEIREGEEYRDLFTVALFTGMREGEVCGLPWSAVDFYKGTVSVRQQLQKEKTKGGSYYIAPTKNDRIRTLTVAPFVMDILSRVRREQNENAAHVGKYWKNEFDLVFTDTSGKYITPANALKHFKKAVTKIGRADARFHDMRHTYAVTSLQEGDDVKTVQQNLGHATASFTLDVYGHVSDKMNRESAARMQAYFEKLRK